MVILEPAGDSKWICVDFIDSGVFWGEKVGWQRGWPWPGVGQLAARDYTGVVALKKDVDPEPPF